MGIAHIKSLVTTATTGAHYLGEHQCRIIGYSKKCCHVANKTVWHLWLNKNLIIMKKNDDIQDLYLQCKNVVFDKGCQWSDSGPIIKKMVTVQLHCNHLHVASWYNPLEFYETLTRPHKATRAAGANNKQDGKEKQEEEYHPPPSASSTATPHMVCETLLLVKATLQGRWYQ